jgi:hypothetical protein
MVIIQKETFLSILVVVRSMAYVCGRLIAGIVGLNPASGLLCVV